MRRPDGRMSKKDRRAIAAFGLRPSEPEQAPAGGHALVFGSSGVRWVNSWGNTANTVPNGTLWVSPLSNTVKVQVDGTWQVAMDFTMTAD